MLSTFIVKSSIAFWRIVTTSLTHTASTHAKHVCCTPMAEVTEIYQKLDQPNRRCVIRYTGMSFSLSLSLLLALSPCRLSYEKKCLAIQYTFPPTPPHRHTHTQVQWSEKESVNWWRRKKERRCDHLTEKGWGRKKNYIENWNITQHCSFTRRTYDGDMISNNKLSTRNASSLEIFNVHPSDCIRNECELWSRCWMSCIKSHEIASRKSDSGKRQSVDWLQSYYSIKMKISEWISASNTKMTGEWLVFFITKKDCQAQYECTSTPHRTNIRVPKYAQKHFFAVFLVKSFQKQGSRAIEKHHRLSLSLFFSPAHIFLHLLSPIKNDNLISERWNYFISIAIAMHI